MLAVLKSSIKGVFLPKVVKLFNFLFYVKKCHQLLRVTCQIFRGLAAPERKGGPAGVRKNSYCCEIVMIIPGSGVKDREKIRNKI